MKHDLGQGWYANFTVSHEGREILIVGHKDGEQIELNQASIIRLRQAMNATPALDRSFA